MLKNIQKKRRLVMQERNRDMPYQEEEDLVTQRRRYQHILEEKDLETKQLKHKVVKANNQSDVMKVQNELKQLLRSPKANKEEIQRCKNWLSKHGPSSYPKPVQLTSRQRTTKMLLGYVPEPKTPKHKGGLLGFLERIQ